MRWVASASVRGHIAGWGGVAEAPRRLARNVSPTGVCTPDFPLEIRDSPHFSAA